MACCVVLNRLPRGVRGDDSVGKSSCAAPNRPNPEPQPQPLVPPVSCGASATLSRPPSRGLDTVGDHGISVNMAADFKEPWSKLLSLAKQKSRQTRFKAKEASGRIAVRRSELEKVKGKKAAGSTVPKAKNGVMKHSKAENNPNVAATRTTMSKSGTDNVSVDAPLEQDRMSRVSAQGKRKSRQRALSVEWDYSGSESADTPSVPQNKKKKAPKKRKRDTSIEKDWAPNDLDSECSDSQTKNDFDALHECSICSLKFKRPWRLRVHLQQHLQPDIRPFKCDEDGCSKGYFYKIHLDRHKSRSHSDLVVTFKTTCPSQGCNRIFDSHSGLKRHINKMHSVENLKFHCPHCDKKFSKNRQLRFHIAEHNGEPPLRCEKCNMGVFSDRELKHHMRTHKEYACDVSGCDKVFSKYPAFQKHKAEHNKCFQTLKCAHCNKEFKKKSELRDHVMTHLDQRTIYKCTYDSCPRFYYQERNLRSHIRVYHEKSSNFACSWEGCEMQFLSRKALDKHLNVHENGRAEMKRKEGPKAPRKDKGKPKRAMATQLAGMPIHLGVEKALLAPDRIVEICDSEGEENLDSCSSTNKNRCSKSTRSKAREKVSTSENHRKNENCSTDSVKIVNENSVIVLQDERGVYPPPVEENDSIITSLTGKVFEIGEGGVLVEVEENSPVNAVINSDPHTEIFPCTSSLLDKEQSLEIVDGSIVIDFGEIPLTPENVTISQSVEENIPFEQVSSCIEDYSNETTLSERARLSETGDANDISALIDSSLTPNNDVSITNSTNRNSHLETCLNSAAEPQKENNEDIVHAPEKSVVMVEINEMDAVGKSNSLPFSGEKRCGTISNQKLGNTVRNNVELVSPQNESQTDENAYEYQRECSLSATLCAETIVDGPHGESEVFLLIPGLKLSAGDASSAAVVKALSGDLEVYSVAGTNSNEILCESSLESSQRNPMRRVSINDPSVTSVLQPLIQDLAKKSGLCTNGAKNASKPAKQLFRNPAHTRNVVSKLAEFIRANAEKAPVKASKCKSGRSLKDNLQGPTQEATQSDNSSVSESDDSRSDSGSDDHNNDNEDEDGEVDDNLSSDGDGGNEDDEDGDDEDEDDEQPDDEDTGDEEDINDDDDENGNDGAGYLNGGDNNNNDHSESHSEGSEEQADPDSSNGHQHVNDGSDLGVERASSPKQNTLDKDDDVSSTHSDDLIIDVEDIADKTGPAEKLNSQLVEQQIATVKTSPKCVPSPGKDYSKVRRQSSRVKKVNVSLPQEDQKLTHHVTDFIKPRLKCVHCTIEIKKRCDLRDHILKSHPDQKIFLCTHDSCSSFFYQERSLKRHLSDCHETSKFSCRWKGCKMQFGDSEALTEHIIVHKSVSAKPNGSKSEGEKADSLIKKNTKDRQQMQAARKAPKRKIKISIKEEKLKKPAKVNTSENESDSSGSDIIRPVKKRRCNIGDDSDSSVGSSQKINGNPSGLLNNTVKEENHEDLESSQDLKSPIHVSLRAVDTNQLCSFKSLPVSPSEDPLHIPVKNEISLLEPKMESRTTIACSQLSEKAWIRVLRQASKVMKLSLTAAEN